MGASAPCEYTGARLSGSTKRRSRRGKNELAKLASAVARQASADDMYDNRKLARSSNLAQDHLARTVETDGQRVGSAAADEQNGPLLDES